LGLVDNKDKPSSLYSAVTITKKTGRLLKELAIFLGHLSKELITFIAKKARTEGVPKAIQALYFAKRSNLVCWQKAKDERST
jgi:hypothetical protein